MNTARVRGLPCVMELAMHACAQMQETAEVEQEEAARCHARLEHLVKIGAAPKDGALTWNFGRMDRILADHMLRSGHLASAQQLAEEAHIEARSLFCRCMRMSAGHQITGSPFQSCKEQLVAVHAGDHAPV